MKTVLSFQSSFSAVCRRVADGVRDFAAKVGWRLHVIPYANAAEQEMLGAREWRSLDAIANFCGYDSDSTLRKAFRARLGLSPSAWRKSRQSATV